MQSAICSLQSAVCSLQSVVCSLQKEKLFITPKRKSSYRSVSEPSPEDKRLKKSDSPAKISSDEDGVME